jgi:hypothetical protein
LFKQDIYSAAEKYNVGYFTGKIVPL